MVSMLLVSRGTITHNPEAKLKPLPDTYLVQYLNQLIISQRNSSQSHISVIDLTTTSRGQVSKGLNDLDNTCAIQAVARVAPKTSVL